MKQNKIKIGSNRSFGIVFFVVFLIISIWPLLDEKEFVTINNVKYEQAKYSAKPDMEQLLKIDNGSSHFIQIWYVSLCSVIGNHGYTCVAPFQVTTAAVALVEDDVVENHWTILRTIT